MSTPARIVILGGGFAGATTALELERLLRRRNDVEIMLVDNENFFTFTPLLPEVPSGSIQAQHIVFPLRALLRKTVVRQAQVRSVDFESKTVTARHCPACAEYSVEFDQLVLALGSVPSFFNLSGIEQHALTMKSLADATALHAHLIDKLEHAELEPEEQARREILTFVVAGGGFAGVETLAEVNDFVRGAGRLLSKNPAIRHSDGAGPFWRSNPAGSGHRALRITLSRSSVRAASRPAYKRDLRNSTVDGSCSAMVTRFPREHWFGPREPRRARSWTESTCRDSRAARSKSTPRWRYTTDLEYGRLATSRRFRTWLAATPAPPTAQHALRQGKRLARNIVARLQGDKPQPFAYKPLGLLAGLGRRAAVAEILGFRFSGFFAWWLWAPVYLMKLPSLERKIRVAIDWTLDLFFPRDMVYLRSLHTVQTPGVPPTASEEKSLDSKRLDIV